MPKPHGRRFADDPEFAEYDMQHNPGHDLVRMLTQAAQAEQKHFNKCFASYARNPIAVLLGAAAIEGYTNYVGSNVSRDWDSYIKTTKGFSEKLKRLFSVRKISGIDLGSGIYQKSDCFDKFPRKIGTSQICPAYPSWEVASTNSL